MAYLQTQSRLFSLPRELRDDIYPLYVVQEHGYRCEANNKLVGIDHTIEFDLTMTCRLIAEEMQGMHLRANEITFTPTPAGEEPAHRSDKSG